MTNTAPETTEMSFAAWLVRSVVLTLVVVFVVSLLPPHLKLLGLINVATGAAIGIGSRWIACDSGTKIVPAVESCWKPAVVLVLLMVIVGQVAISGWGWFQYRSHIRRAWGSDPTALFAAKLLDGQVPANDPNGQSPLDHMQQLFDDSSEQRAKALQTKRSWTTWVVRRVDQLNIDSPAMANGFWFGEICLGSLVALFGFVRRPINNHLPDGQMR